MRCCYCNKEVEQDSVYDYYFCSEKCANKYYIAESKETIEYNRVTCPYCYDDQDIDSSYYEANDSLIECDCCHKTFILNAETVTRFTANATDEEIEKEYQRQKDEESEELR